MHVVVMVVVVVVESIIGCGLWVGGRVAFGVLFLGGGRRFGKKY